MTKTLPDLVDDPIGYWTARDVSCKIGDLFAESRCSFLQIVNGDCFWFFTKIRCVAIQPKRILVFTRFSGFRHSLHAPRIRETCGKESTRAAISLGSEFLISSTETALATSKRPDFTRRNAYKCAPQPSSAPISCA